MIEGATVVATGATSGIGEQAALALARQGARILLVARSPERAKATLAGLEAAAPGRGHKAYFADLSRMREARRVGAEISAQEPRVDVLINNAGAAYGDRRVTSEGLESVFATNHMAYFVLTLALLDRLRAAPAGRVVSTASDAHRGVSLDFDDLQSERRFVGFRAYQRSKLANILFTRELARRLAGGTVTANCLHPGLVASRLGDDAGGWLAPAFWLVKRFSGITPQKGAETLVYLASSPEVAGVSGEYFAHGKIAPTSDAARDMTAAARLWDMSERLAAQSADSATASVT